MIYFMLPQEQTFDLHLERQREIKRERKRDRDKNLANLLVTKKKSSLVFLHTLQGEEDAWGC